MTRSRMVHCKKNKYPNWQTDTKRIQHAFNGYASVWHHYILSVLSLVLFYYYYLICQCKSKRCINAKRRLFQLGFDEGCCWWRSESLLITTWKKTGFIDQVKYVTMAPCIFLHNNNNNTTTVHQSRKRRKIKRMFWILQVRLQKVKNNGAACCVVSNKFYKNYDKVEGVFNSNMGRTILKKFLIFVHKVCIK